MEWIDTHAHLFHEAFQNDLPNVLQRAKQAGVRHIYMPNLDTESLSAMCALEKIADNPRCYACVGLHPCYVEEEKMEKQLAILEKALEKRAFSAIGETGLDTYHTPDQLPQQEKAFLRHCMWAKKYKLPLLLHGRGTTARLLDLLKVDKPAAGGIFHCFSGTYEQAIQAIELGFLIGIGGIITYKSSDTLRDVVRRLPLSALVLETDAPYLCPSGQRNQRNEPAFLPLIAKLIAKKRGCTIEEIALQTSINARNLFRSLPV